MISPEDHGLKAWTFDPALAAAGAALVDGVISLVGIRFRFPARISKIHAVVTTAGATIANCFAGLYDPAGNRLGVTADQAAGWAATGAKAMALAAAVDVRAGWHYVALLEGSGTTDVQFARGPAGAVAALNAGTAAPKVRASVSGASLTALPATIAVGSLDPAAAGAINYWAGVS